MNEAAMADVEEKNSKIEAAAVKKSLHVLIVL